MTIGYIFALLTSVGMSLYIVPKKFSKHTSRDYTMFLAMGFSVCSLVYLFGTNSLKLLNNSYLIYSCLTGVIWTIGSICFATAIDKIGLSRGGQWKNLQGPSGAIISLIFLGETTQTNIWLILLAATLLFTSAIMFTIKHDDGKSVSKSGVAFAITSGVIFGITSVIQKYVSSHVTTMPPQQICFAFSIFITSIIYILFKDKTLRVFVTTFKKDSLMGLLAGILYFLTSYCQVASYKYLPNAIAVTILQFNVVWTILIGILIFHEINFKKNWKRIAFGYILAFASLWALLNA